MTPFEVLKTDIDDFIILINYLMNIEQTETRPKGKTKKEQRIKVNDETATGGWF